MPFPPDLRGWVPAFAQYDDGRLWTELCRVGDRPFIEPFFEDSLAVGMRRPFNAVFRRRIDMDCLYEVLERQPGLPVGGFVFHVSRCGSTLLSQWLAACESHRVMSEPAGLDAALRAGGADIDDARRRSWLRAMVRLLAQSGRPQEQRLFIKFDSWHCHFLPLVRQVFPDVPWVVLLRDPVEVIVSHLREPGAQMVPGLADFAPPGVDLATAWQLPREEYCARMLGGYHEAIEAACADGLGPGRLLDYSGLVTSLGDDMATHFGVQPDQAARAAMEAVLTRNAKHPHLPFTEEGPAKRTAAPDAVIQAAQTWVMPAYRRLLARMGREPPV